MFVAYPDERHQNRLMLFLFHSEPVSVPPIAKLLSALPRHADWVVQSVKTSIHLDQITTSHHGMQLVPLASLCAFFAAVILIRTVDPMLRSTPIHAHFYQSLADCVCVNLMRRPSLLMTYFRQHFQRPKTAFLAMLSWRLADEFPQSLTGIIIVCSLIIMPCSRKQFQAAYSCLIEGVQHIPDLLITLSNTLTDLLGRLSLICTHQDDLAAPYGCTDRRFQPTFQLLTLFFTRFSCIDCFHRPILSLIKLSAPVLH